MNLSENLSNQITEKNIYGSFYLSNCEFALSVSYLQEVVNAPDSYTAVPLAPDYLKGLFNLRGTIIPVLDLRKLLGLQQSGDADIKRKVAIVELNGVCVGLLFDKTGDVFREVADEKNNFEGHESNVISGVFKKESGQRMVQILNINNLFKLNNIPKDYEKNRLGRENISKKRGIKKQSISFWVGPAKCSLFITDIQEIIKMERIIDSALCGDQCIGMLDLRGTTVPVIDFGALLQYRAIDRSEKVTPSDRRVIIMKCENLLVGLMVDSIDSIVSFFPDEMLPFPVIEQNKAEMFLGCITGHGEVDILLLNSQKILSNTELVSLTKGHNSLYQMGLEDAKQVSSKKSNRQSYITFRIDESYAIAINEVKEIIDFPKQLLHPPGMKSYVRGILNLRGDLVTIIDARTLYKHETDAGSDEKQKVLVFKCGIQLVGLIVDSVESIVSIADSEKVKLPKLLYDQVEGEISNDISEAVQVVDMSGVKRNMLILSLTSIANRAGFMACA